MWSYVGSKENKHSYLACYRRYNTLLLLGYILAIAPVYRQNSYGDSAALARNERLASSSVSSMCCLLHRFLGGVCVQVLPSKRHRPVGKDSGHTSYIERLNNTLRNTNFTVSA